MIAGVWAAVILLEQVVALQLYDLVRWTVVLEVLLLLAARRDDWLQRLADALGRDATNPSNLVADLGVIVALPPGAGASRHGMPTFVPLCSPRAVDVRILRLNGYSLVGLLPCGDDRRCFASR